MRMNDSEMTMRRATKRRQFRRFASKGSLDRETKEEKKSERYGFEFFEKDRRKKRKLR
jgi:hypothetical protein